MSGRLIPFEPPARPTGVGTRRRLEDIDRLQAALADGWERERQLMAAVSLLLCERDDLVADRDRWAAEWATLSALATSGPTDLPERRCCYCGRLYVGPVKACSEHAFLLTRETREATPDRRELDRLVTDLLPAVSDLAETRLE